MGFRFRVGAGVIAMTVLLSGCSAMTPPQATPTFDFDVPPRWVDDEELGEPRVSFAGGIEFGPDSTVEFRSRLAGVYDWEVVGPVEASRTELVNVNAGCRVLDETTAYAGDDGDEDASRELIVGLLAGDEIIGGPGPSVAGIGEGLGEGAPHYEVMHALARSPDGGYVYVTGRVFASVGIQHAITVRCELGGYLDRTRAQLIQTTWVELDLPEDEPPPVVVARACTIDDLAVDYEPFAPGVNESTGILEFRNRGSETCSVGGHPVVHLAAPGSDDPHGPPAEQGVSYSAAPFDLAPGQSATAALTILRASTRCASPITTDGLLIAPPTEAFDPDAPAQRLRVDGLEICPDPTVQLLTVGGIGR